MIPEYADARRACTRLVVIVGGWYAESGLRPLQPSSHGSPAYSARAYLRMLRHPGLMAINEGDTIAVCRSFAAVFVGLGSCDLGVHMAVTYDGTSVVELVALVDSAPLVLEHPV